MTGGTISRGTRVPIRLLTSHGGTRHHQRPNRQRVDERDHPAADIQEPNRSAAHRDGAGGRRTPVEEVCRPAGLSGSSIWTLKRASPHAAQIANTIAAIQPRLPSDFSPQK